MNRSHAETAYSPLYFLAALGAGGLAVTFFMYLMFWVPHPGQPVPVVEDILRYWSGAALPGKAMVAIAMAGIAVFTLMHLRLLLWNFRHLSLFRRTEQFTALHQSNAETQMKAVPLTLAMTINVSFIAGLVFIPGLWNVVEYLFPLALIAFLAVGIFAFGLIGRFLGRILTQGGFDMTANNSFAQLLPAFAMSMVSVGLAAPAAMSKTPWIVGASLTFSTFFMVAAVVITVIALALAMFSLMQHGAAEEAAPTLMVVVPIMTVLGIAWMRQSHGLHTTLDVHGAAGETFATLTQFLSIQVLFLMLGLLVLQRQGYAAKFLSKDGIRSAGSYALVCPGVALSVMIHFWVNKGLVASGLIAKFGVLYWTLTGPALLAQIAMILLVLRLGSLHFAKGAKPAAMPAQ